MNKLHNEAARGKGGINRNQSKGRGNKRGVKRWIYGISISIVVALGCFVAPLLASRSQQRAIIIVPENATMQQLGDTLEKHLGISFSRQTLTAARAMGGAFHLRSGAYEVRKGVSALGAARAIGRGRQYIVNLSLNNIRTLDDLAERCAGKLSFSASELLDYLGRPEVARKYGLTPESAMALFIADNYEMYWKTTPEEFIDKIGARYEKFWDASRKKKASDLGLTPLEVSIIASIADEESNKGDEKGRICRLYMNRLKKNMRLQADPTVKFAVGDFGIKRVTKAHLGIESPYNTYRVNGLPPGPIRIIDPKTVDAFLNSSPTDDIYMCAKSDMSGYHDFTSDYSEHQSNARRYQEKLNQLKIK